VVGAEFVEWERWALKVAHDTGALSKRTEEHQKNADTRNADRPPR